MAKRKTDLVTIDPTDGISPAEASAAGQVLRMVQDPLPAPEDSSGKSYQMPAEEELPYVVGIWAGQPQWRCRFCPWDTLESEAAARDHYQDRHALPSPPPSGLVRADRQGRPIE